MWDRLLIDCDRKLSIYVRLEVNRTQITCNDAQPQLQLRPVVWLGSLMPISTFNHGHLSNDPSARFSRTDTHTAASSFIKHKLVQCPPCGETVPTCELLTLPYLFPLSRDRELTYWSYISYRQSYAHHPAKKPKYSSASGNGYSDTIGGGSEERRGLMSSGAFEDDGDAVIEMDLLPPRWADVSDEVTEYLADIASKSAKLEKLHQKHVLPGFDDEDVKRREEGEIERLTQDITKGFHDCQKAIQRVEMMVRESKKSGGISKGEETMARNIQISLAGRVQEASAGFRKKQSAYLKSMFPHSSLKKGRDPDCSRTPRGIRNATTTRPLHRTHIYQLHRSLNDGIRRRQILLPIHPPTNLPKTAHI